jgi:hypothetical protein
MSTEYAGTAVEMSNGAVAAPRVERKNDYIQRLKKNPTIMWAGRIAALPFRGFAQYQAA